MTVRVRLLVLTGVVLAGVALFVQPQPRARVMAGGCCPDRFDPVFEIMNRPGSKMGCLGCHIGPRPGIGPWFGPDQDSVRTSLETGITYDGQEMSQVPVDGGRSGYL